MLILYQITIFDRVRKFLDLSLKYIRNDIKSIFRKI